MATASKTWAFASDAEGLTDQGVGAAVAFAANTGDGNPAGSVAFTCANKAVTQTERARKSTTGDTFASLFGIGAGDTISAVRITGLSDKVAAVAKLSSHSVTVRLVDDAGSTIATLLSARNPGNTTTAWVAVGAQTSQSISKTGADGCRLEIEYTVTTSGGSGSASTDYRIDQIAVEVTYTVAAQTLDPGKVTSGQAVRGADLAPGTATLSGGKVASAEAVRGVAFAQGNPTITAGKAASGEVVRGADLFSSIRDVNLNGLHKDYDLHGATELHVDPTGQTWQAGATIACPQGDVYNVVALKGSPYDTGFEPRATGDGFFATVARSSDGKLYSSNMKVVGTSSTTEPSTASYDTSDPYHSNVFADGDIRWQHVPAGQSVGWTFQGARQDSHAYAVGDVFTQNGKLWRVVIAGTSAASAPAFYGTADYGSFNFDSGAGVIAQGKFEGAWQASHTYTGVATNTGRTTVVPIFITTNSGADLWIWDGVYGTWGTTGGTEPAWGSAADSQKYWIDNDVLWIRGADLFGSVLTGRERAVITGFAPEADGHQVTVYNDGTAASEQDVVLADRNALEPQSGVDFESKGSDAESTHYFDFGGSDIRVEAGQSVTLEYSTATGVWTQVAAALTLDAGKVASGEAVRGATLAPGTVALAAGKVATGEAVRGVALAPGTVALAAGKVASTEAVRGVDLSQGVAHLAVGKITSAEAVRGADLAPDTATLTAGKVASGAAVRGATLAPGPVALGAGKVASTEAVRGIEFAQGVTHLTVGKVAGTAAVRGADLTPGTATLGAAKVPSGAFVRGADLTPGTVTAAVGRVASGAAVRGVHLAITEFLTVGKVQSAGAVRGADLTPGTATLALGRLASGAATRGVALAPVGSAALTLGTITSAAVVRGVSVTRAGIGTVTVSDRALGTVTLVDTATASVALSDTAGSVTLTETPI